MGKEAIMQSKIERYLIEIAEMGGANYTDVGNGKRFALYYGDRMRYCWTWGRWLVWDGKRWNLEAGDEQAKLLAKQISALILEEIRGQSVQFERESGGRWAFQSERSARVAATLEMACTEPQVSSYKRDYDNDVYLFNCQNGVLDLRNGGLLTQTPDLMLTQLAPVKFDENAKCPKWMEYLKTWMDGDDNKIEYLQRLMGSCLTGDTVGRTFPIFFGAGFNGKSTFLDTIDELMGDYSMQAPENLLEQSKIHTHPCDIASLMGKRLVIADETKKNMMLRTPLIKRMTGDRKLNARFMRQNYFEFVTTHKTILMTQNKPRITETTDAIWDRVALIEWPIRIEKEKRIPHLSEQLRSEWPGILNWLIEGCIKWQQAEGDLPKPEIIESATLQYRHDEDSLGDFFEEYIIFDLPENRVRRADVRKIYNKWAAQNNIKYPLSARSLNEELRNRGVRDSVQKINGKTCQCWLSIGIKDETDDLPF